MKMLELSAKISLLVSTNKIVCKLSFNPLHATDLESIVHLIHEGSVLPNNSVLFLDSLGNGSANSSSPLRCVTPLQPCCDTNRSGSWFYDVNPLDEFENSTELYQSWGDDQSIELNRGDGASTIEGGLYHCEVPDADNVTQILYIGIYSSDNEGGLDS